MSAERTPLTNEFIASQLPHLHNDVALCAAFADHARRLERDRARLMECLRRFDANYQDGYIVGHRLIIKYARKLLRELEGK